VTVSAFSVIKNEQDFIGHGAMSLLPHVDEIVYFDSSTDGTLRLLDYIKEKYDPSGKIKIFKNRDFTDFKENYVKTFNECMKECSGSYLLYAHPDMILTKPGILANREQMSGLAYYVNMRSFAGEDLKTEITKGRTNKWKTIMRNGFGLKYWGCYGDPNEDMYFTAITGNQHNVYKDMRQYPFIVEDSGIHLEHFCESKPRKRREQKMETVFKTVFNINDKGSLFDLVMNHPRVHLESQNSQFGEFEFAPRKDELPEVFSKYKDEFEAVLK